MSHLGLRTVSVSSHQSFIKAARATWCAHCFLSAQPRGRTSELSTGPFSETGICQAPSERGRKCRSSRVALFSLFKHFCHLNNSTVESIMVDACAGTKPNLSSSNLGTKSYYHLIKFPPPPARGRLLWKGSGLRLP